MPDNYGARGGKSDSYTSRGNADSYGGSKADTYGSRTDAYGGGKTDEESSRGKWDYGSRNKGDDHSAYSSKCRRFGSSSALAAW